MSPPSRFTRRQRLLLASICLVGFLRGAYWALTLPIWHPIDEAAHFAFVASIGSGKGIPTVGRDLAPPEVFRIAKQHPAQAIVPFSPDRPELWGTSGQQYEGIQPPVYYALMGGIYALWGTPSAGLVLMMRLVTVALGVAAIPLTALAAARLFPDRPAVRLGAPVLLTVMPAAGGYSAYITNDGATLTAAAAILWASAVIFRDKPGVKQALMAGIVAGAGFLTRNSLILLVPLTAALLLRSCRTSEVCPTRTAKLLGILGAAFGALALPWLAWTRLAYRGTSVTEEFAELIRPIAGTQARTMAGFRRHVAESANGWFEFLWPQPPPTRFFLAAAAVVCVALAAGQIVAHRKNDREARFTLWWLAAVVPVGIVGMFLIIQYAAGGVGGMLGRYLLFSLPFLAVLSAGGLVIGFGSQAGRILIALAAAASVVAAGSAEEGYFTASYARETLGPLAPVVDQSYNDGWEPRATVRFVAPCPAQAISILFKELPPVSVRMRAAGGVPVDLRLSEAVPITFGSFGIYRLPPGVERTFEVDPGQETEVGRSLGSRSPALSLRLSGIESKGDPVARIYCETRDSRKSRFLQINPVGRTMPGTYGLLAAWPRAWRVLAVVFLVAVVIGQLRPGARKRTHEKG